jgi:hypothetical protein
MLSRPNCSASATNATSKHHGGTHPDLGRGVLQPRERQLQSTGPGQEAHHCRGRRDQGHERAEQHQSATGAGAGGGEQQREQHDRGEVGCGGCGDDGLAEPALHPAGVLQDRHDQAE